MNQLQLFYENHALRDAVQEFLLSYVRQDAVDTLFAGKDATGHKAANDVLGKAFSRLREEFEPKKITNVTSSR